MPLMPNMNCDASVTDGILVHPSRKAEQRHRTAETP